jgi:hypothetical protein
VLTFATVQNEIEPADELIHHTSLLGLNPPEDQPAPTVKTAVTSESGTPTA